MGKIIDIIPASPEWHAYRASRIGASDSSVILGISPHKSSKQLYDEKINGISQSDNFAMKRGREREVEAIRWADNYFNTTFCSRVIEHEKHGWKFCTVDGISPDMKLVVEVKFANSEVHELAKQETVVDYYYSQVQSQIACCDVPYAYFLSCYQAKGSPCEFVLVKVERDQKYIDEMISKEKEWYTNHIVMMEEPELTDRDYIKLEEEKALKVDSLLDEEFRISEFIKDLEKQKKLIRDEAMSISPHQSFKTDKYKATKFKVKGNVDYSSIEALKEVNLDLYRKESREQWKITKN